MTDTEALKALVALARKLPKLPFAERDGVQNADFAMATVKALPALERMLASQMGEPFGWLRANGHFERGAELISKHPQDAEGAIPLYAAPAAGMDADSSPPLPSDKLRGLVRKWREQANTLRTEKPDFSDGLSASRDECADELEALLSQEPSSGAVGELLIRDGIVSFHTLVPIEQLHEGPLFASPVTGGK